MTERIVDEELGVVFIQRRANARHVKFRNMSDGIYVTMPSNVNDEEVKRTVKLIRQRMQERGEKTSTSIIDFDYRIDAHYFKFSLRPCKGERITAHSELGELIVSCPETTVFNDDKFQHWMRKVINEALKRNAEIVLPPRLYMFAQQHGYSYNAVKIYSALGAWGCCTSHDDIKLSWRLLLLPPHLMDYVLLHELCHTRHKNHGPSFWNELNGLVGTDARQLQNELTRAQIII